MGSQWNIYETEQVIKSVSQIKQVNNVQIIMNWSKIRWNICTITWITDCKMGYHNGKTVTRPFDHSKGFGVNDSSNIVYVSDEWIGLVHKTNQHSIVCQIISRVCKLCYNRLNKGNL